MRRVLVRIAPALHLTRITTAFAAVANVWFVILWTRGVPQESAAQIDSASLWYLLGASALNALGLFWFATSLNDVLDVRRDAALHPERPIPSGRMSLEAALALVIGSLMLAVVSAAALSISAVILTTLVACAILVLNALGKYVPAVGLLLLGLIYAGQMVVPNLELRFVWPVWLVMTHALAVAWTTHVISGKKPPISRRALACAGAGWMFWSIVMASFGIIRSVPETAGEPALVAIERSLWPAWVMPGAAVGPALLVVLFILFAWRKIHAVGRGPRAAEKVYRYGALWLSLYALAWLVGQGLWTGATILGMLSLAGFLGMTVLRELFALIEQPLVYRR
jgi:hypothetical protein